MKRPVASGTRSAIIAARRDLVAGGVTLAAILVFVGTGSSVLGSALRAINGIGAGTDRLLLVTVLLNIALILFGWRRYRDTARELVDPMAAERRASEAAATDPLTGFLNRGAFKQ